MREVTSYARELLARPIVTHDDVHVLVDKMLFAFETQATQLRARLSHYDDTIRDSLLELTAAHMLQKVHIQPGAVGASPKSQLPLDIRQQLVHASMHWDFDAVEFERASEGKGMEHMFMFFVHDCSSALDTLGLDRLQMETFIKMIANGYCQPPYHNRAHAISVLHAMHMMLQHGGVLDQVGSDPGKQSLYLLASLMAAAAHDVGHPGVSNAFLIDTRHPLAMAWNDQSPLENMHLAKLFEALEVSKVLENLGKEAQRTMRELLIALVLATDMKHHMTVAQQFEATTLGRCMDTREQELRVLKMCIKCADLGHTCMKWPRHMAWVKALQKELHMQGVAEMRAGCKVTALTDPNKTTLFDGQTGFFDVIVLPTYRLLVNAFPACAPLLHEASSNYNTWQSQTCSDQPVG
jgi:hypothetical protein